MLFLSCKDSFQPFLKKYCEQRLRQGRIYYLISDTFVQAGKRIDTVDFLHADFVVNLK